MRILFAIQGTGNGHISRAREIIPHLKQYGSVDILISGTQADVQLGVPVKYQKKGIGYVFGKNGGINYWKAFKELRTDLFLKEVLTFPLKKYNVIINDFEPITAWGAFLRDIPCVSLSHQSAFLSANTPRPEKKVKISELILRKYAPCSKAVGLHFQPYDSFIHTPVVRSEIRKLESTNGEHFTVYLPSYSDDALYSVLKKHKHVNWQVFSKHNSRPYTEGNVIFQPVNNELFNQSLASGAGLLCGAGFESPAEALYLGKKLMVIPMKGQYEQQCNAAALQQMGVPVVARIQELTTEVLDNWLDSTVIAVKYADNTASLVEKAMVLNN